MKLINKNADFFSPAGLPLYDTTHLCIAAHQDDVEIMAAAPILECFGKRDKWFSAVVLSDGAGSPRSGVYASCTDEDMKAVRLSEQRCAAQIGGYLAMLQLGYTSAGIKQRENTALESEIRDIILKTNPEIVYVHNLMDKHPTHVASAVRAILALRGIPKDKRPGKLVACEVWRGLDWLSDRHKLVMDTSSRPNLTAALIGVFDSQVAGGKRYDLATEGRRLANATYFESHGVDAVDSMNFGLDLTALIEDDSLSVKDFAMRFIEDFKQDALEALNAAL